MFCEILVHFFPKKTEVFLSKQTILLSREDHSKKLCDSWGLTLVVKYVLCVSGLCSGSILLTKGKNLMLSSEVWDQRFK